MDYIKDFCLSEHEALFYMLSQELDWVQIKNRPRQEYWTTTNGANYIYGTGRGKTTYEPQRPHAIIDVLRARLIKLAESKGYSADFHGCFANHYIDGTKHLGWHSDDDLAIDHDSPIAIVTLGNGRVLEWKEIGSKGQKAIQGTKLESGSVLFMPPGFQHTHQHRIPKAQPHEEIGPRISLTYRTLKEY